MGAGPTQARSHGLTDQTLELLPRDWRVQPVRHPIGRHVRSCYERLFTGRAAPAAGLPIHRGKALAALLNYPLELLNDIPDRLWEHFLPCGNPLPYLQPKGGERILNLGSGIGIDSLALVQRSAPDIHVVNVDVVTEALVLSRNLTRQEKTAFRAFEARLSWVCAEGDLLPFHPDSFDWVLMNGVFNLFPDKVRLLSQVFRSLKVDGGLVIMDLGVSGELPEYFAEERDGWAWCMSGACTRPQLMLLMESAGFRVELFEEGDPADLLYPMGLVARKISCADGSVSG